MEPFQRSSGDLSPVPADERRQRSHRPAPRIRTPKAYLVCDAVTFGLIVVLLVFTPWAFGTTQPWSIQVANSVAFMLGVVLVVKWVIRKQTGYRPPRWTDPAESDDVPPTAPDLLTHRMGDSPRTGGDDLFPGIAPLGSSRAWNCGQLLTISLAVLTVLVLGYTLVSALNPRAIYSPWQRVFEYRDHYIPWLPHSYDPTSTWAAFWKYVGLGCFFWATRDWLLGKAARERRALPHRARSAVQIEPRPAPAKAAVLSGGEFPRDPGQPAGRSDLPKRLEWLLWVLCISGAFLALEAILQRLSGTNKLLWLVIPGFNNTADSQFGPYAYRANAASYFNLIWPVCLGFWLVLRQRARPSLRTGHRLGSGHHMVLLPGAVLIAACPIISTARGGAIVGVAAICASVAIVLRTARNEGSWFRVGTIALFVIILGFSAFLGLQQLIPRFKTIFTDQMSHRTEIYENALPLAHEYPVFGTGPGTFGTLYQLYRKNLTQDWHAYLHDDWLETRITYGWVGFGMILLLLAIPFVHSLWGGGIPVPGEFVAMTWVAMGGCLLHAKFDFPFQIYSILCLFLVFAAVLSTVSARR